MHLSRQLLLSRASPPGISLLELLVALVIFSLAMLPILTLTGSHAVQAYSITKHAMASLLAFSLLDRYLALEFDACRQAIADMDGRSVPILEDPELQEDLAKMTQMPFRSSDIQLDLQRSFRSFCYTVTKTESPLASEANLVFAVTVQVSWLVQEGQEHSRQCLTLEALKFNENPF